MTIQQVPDDNQRIIDQSTEGLHITGEDSFESFGASLPSDARSFLDDAAQQPAATSGSEGSFLADASNAPVEPTPAERRQKRVNVSRKWKKAMDRLKGKAAILPIAWFNNQAKSVPEWALDDDEQEMIKESISTVFEVLDIEIAIEPLSWTLTSVWWVVAYPVLVFTFLFLSKKSMVMDKEQKEQQE